MLILSEVAGESACESNPISWECAGQVASNSVGLIVGSVVKSTGDFVKSTGDFVNDSGWCITHLGECVNEGFKTVGETANATGWCTTHPGECAGEILNGVGGYTSDTLKCIWNDDKEACDEAKDGLSLIVDPTTMVPVAGAASKINKINKISKAKNIVKNANNIDDITKQRKIIGDLKRRRISKEAINKLIENGYDLEKAKEVIVNLRNNGVPAKVIDDLIKKDVSLDELNKISKIDIKNPKKYFKELGKFSKSEKIMIKNGDKEITINLIEGDAKKGLTHIWLRHVIGYESDKTATTFFPRGQTVNGKKLPKIVDDADELKEIIRKAIERNKKKFYEDKSGNPGIKYMYEKDGRIIEIKLKFQKVKDGVYELRTMYPEGGDGVYKYVENVGWFKCVGKEGNKWTFKKE
jgi:hypothetical protein